MLSNKIHILRNPEDLRGVPIPQRTATYEPVPYYELFKLTVDRLAQARLSIVQSNIVLARSGNQMFATFVLNKQGDDSDERRMLGLRSSYDKSVANGVAYGTHVVACSNMNFSGDVVEFRKHTRNVHDDLPHLLDSAIGSQEEYYANQLAYMGALDQITITPAEAALFIMNNVDPTLLPPSSIPAVWKNFTSDARGSSAYVLHNAYTNVFGQLSPSTQLERCKYLNAAVAQAFFPDDEDESEAEPV